MLIEGGTKTHPGLTIKDAFASLGIDPTVLVDMEMVSFRLQYLHDDRELALKLFAELFIEPDWDPIQFQKIKEEAIQYLNNDLLASDEGLGKLVYQNWIYQGHPYGHPIQGRTGVIDDITLQDVQHFYRDRYLRSTMVLGGAQSGKEQAFLQLQSELSAAMHSKIYKNVTPKAVSPVNDRQILIVEKDTESTGIVFGHPTTLHRNHPDWPAMQVAIHALGAHRQSFGLLYRELRTERGLNYGDYAYIENYRQAGGSKSMETSVGRLQNSFTVWLRPVSKSNGPFALRASMAIVEELVRTGLSEEEFSTVQQYLSGQIALWGKDGGRRLGWEVESRLMGWGNPLIDLPSKISQLSVEEVNTALSKHLDPTKLKIVVITKNAEEFLNSIEGTSSLIVYDGHEVEEASEQGKEDSAWSQYAVDCAEKYHRTSAGLFQ
jgi:zinc protease